VESAASGTTCVPPACAGTPKAGNALAIEVGSLAWRSAPAPDVVTGRLAARGARPEAVRRGRLGAGATACFERCFDREAAGQGGEEGACERVARAAVIDERDGRGVRVLECPVEAGDRPVGAALHANEAVETGEGLGSLNRLGPGES
jgi:hypothetical protein